MPAVDPKALIADHLRLFQGEEARTKRREEQTRVEQNQIALSVKAAQTRKARADALRAANDKKKLEKEAEAAATRRKVAANRKVRINGN